jgi:hypothetical protein
MVIGVAFSSVSRKPARNVIECRTERPYNQIRPGATRKVRAAATTKTSIMIGCEKAVIGTS